MVSRQSLNTDTHNALFTQALADHNAGRLAQARRGYESLLLTHPGHQQARNNLGVLLQREGEQALALAHLTELARQTPQDARAQANWGVALRTAGQVEQALAAYKAAIAIDPTFHSAYNNLGNLLHEQQQYAAASESFERAVQLDPTNRDYRFMLAKSLLDEGEWERALAELHLCLGGGERDADVWGTMARAWGELRKLPEALGCFERGLQVRSDYAGLIYNRGLARLMAGDMAGGFADYERRFEVPDFPSQRIKTAKPLWQGQHLADQTLLIHAEQGLGDTLQFLRYIDHAASRAKRVLLLIQEQLTSLAVLPANVELVHEGSKTPHFDYVCALLSLPHLLRPEVMLAPLPGADALNIPQNIPYIRQDSDRVAAWNERLTTLRSGMAVASAAGGLNRPLRVGLVWAGNPNQRDDALRSMPLATLRPLLDLDGVEFFSFQVGPRAQDIHSEGLQARITDLAPHLHDYGETVAALGHMDVLLTVCTSMAHAAGALGVPVWVMLRWTADWRWLQHRGDSPWYPSAKLYRQSSMRDWDSVVTRVGNDLRDLTAPDSAGGRKRQAQAHKLVEQGRVLLERNQASLAAPLFWHALRECPTAARAASALAICAYRQTNMHGAVTLGLRGCALAPQDAEAWTNCGAFAKAAGMLSLAETLHRRAIKTNPRSAQAYSNLGNALGAQLAWEEALKAHEKAARLAPGNVEYLYNLGIARKENGLVKQALAAFKKIQSLQPSHVRAELHESLLELLLGDLKSGWRHYESRWLQPDAKEQRNFTQPLWTGQELQGKTILLHAEQGFGDSFQFLRYVPLVAARGAHVVLVVQPDIHTIASRVAGVGTLVHSGHPLPHFDYQCPLLSLPMAFGTTLQSIPQDVPYLSPDPVRKREWAARLGSKKTYRVALVWAGRPTHGNDANRSMRLADLHGLLRLPGVDVYSVQKGDAALAQLNDMPNDLHLHNLSADICDFEDTAAILSLMDELVTVDTSVAHLAGALGCKVRVLLPLIPDWRWLMDRADSPWYPHTQLYRQSRPQDWSKPTKALLLHIRKLAGT